MPFTPEAQAALAAITTTPPLGLRRVQELPRGWREWAVAVWLMAAGDYAGAFTMFEPIRAGGGEAAGAAAAALASGLRQLSEHEGAEPLDREAAATIGLGRCDGLIGLAADHVGQGQVDAARNALDVAASELEHWRDEMRFSWVEAEWNLLAGDAVQAEVCAEQAVRLVAGRGADRHEVKSLLIRAVARDTGQPGSGTADLHLVVARAAAMGLHTLVWPAVLVLGQRANSVERDAGEAAVAFIGQHRPPGAGSRWGGYRQPNDDTL